VRPSWVVMHGTPLAPMRTACTHNDSRTHTPATQTTDMLHTIQYHGNHACARCLMALVASAPHSSEVRLPRPPPRMSPTAPTPNHQPGGRKRWCVGNRGRKRGTSIGLSISAILSVPAEDCTLHTRSLRPARWPSGTRLLLLRFVLSLPEEPQADVRHRQSDDQWAAFDVADDVVKCDRDKHE